MQFTESPLQGAPNRQFEVGVRVENAGDTLWLAQPHDAPGHVRIGFVTHDGDGRRVAKVESAFLPRDVAPGESVSVRRTLGPLTEEGRYALLVDPFSHGLTGFDAVGDQRTTVALTVEPCSDASANAD